MNYLKPIKHSVEMFAASFEDEALHSVQQWLQVFKQDEALLKLVEEEIQKRRRKNLHDASVMDKKRKEAYEDNLTRYEKRELMAKEDTHFPGEPATLPPIGFCPECGSVLGGMFIAGCETKKSGRIFYKECSACSYHVEFYKKRNGYHEEGG